MNVKFAFDVTGEGPHQFTYERAFELLQSIAAHDPLAAKVLEPIFDRLKRLELDSARIDWIGSNNVDDDHHDVDADEHGRAWVVLADNPNQTLREAIDSCAEFERGLSAYIRRGKR